MLEISLFGAITLTINGEQISHAPTKSVFALLAYLVEDRNYDQPHSREKLAELLWPGMPSGSGRKNLRQTIYELKRLLPDDGGIPTFITTRQNVQWNPKAEAIIDTHCFEKYLGSPTIENLQQAIECYQRDFLVEFCLPNCAEFESWAQNRREYYRRRYRDALGTLADLDPPQAETYLRRVLESDPLDEEALCKLMTILVDRSARSDALRRYEKFRQQLADELGAIPHLDTVSLYEQILQGESGGDSPPRSIPTKSPIITSHLPTLLTPFIGRHAEVEKITALLQKPVHHLITLTGPGGMGKTRLALRVASEVAETFPDGVYFAPLASVQSTEGIVSTLARSIKFSFYNEEETHKQQLLFYIREKQMLLIVDSFEHLIADSSLIAEILAKAPFVKLIVTSRLSLNLQGEQLYPVERMAIPDVSMENPVEEAKSFGAIQLFLSCARRARPTFVLTKENVLAVIEICKLVQGMPLGIELAATWLELLPPNEIVKEITSNLDFLETDKANIPERQRSIRAVFESSLKLLSKEEKDAFLKLCVFVESFSIEAALQVSGASLRTLLGLVDKSWLQQIDEGRYQLHLLLHHYGLEHLNADPETWRGAKDAHATYFVEFIAEQFARMCGPEQLAGVTAFEDEYNTNIKATWDWLIAKGRWEEITGPMALGFFQFGTIRMPMREMTSWLRDARLKLELEKGSGNRLPLAIISILEVYFDYCENTYTHKPLERLAAIWQQTKQQDYVDTLDIWFILLARMVQVTNLDADTEEQIEKAITRIRSLDDPWKLGISLLAQRGWIERREESFDENNLLEALHIFKKLGVLYEQGFTYLFLGLHAGFSHKPINDIVNYLQQADQFLERSGFPPTTVPLAEAYFQAGMIKEGFASLHKSQRILEQLGNTRMLASAFQAEALFAARFSTFEHALEKGLRSLELERQLDYQPYLSWRLYEVGDLYRIFGKFEEAIEFYEQAYIEFVKTDILLGLGYYQRAYGDIALKNGQYSEALDHYNKFYKYATQDNHFWSMSQAHAKISFALTYLGKIVDAREKMITALGEADAVGQIDLELLALLTEALCLLKEEHHEQCVEITSLIIHHPNSWNETKEHANKILDSASRNLSQERFEAAQQRGREMVLDEVIPTIIV